MPLAGSALSSNLSWVSMPELPEVETIRRQLAPRVEGRVLARLEILDPRWSRPLAPAELTAALETAAMRQSPPPP